MRVVHPFHPLAGQDFDFVKRRKSWAVDVVYFYDSAGELAWLPADWTDAVAPDPFVVVSAGRSPFHVAHLLERAELVDQLRGARRATVKRTMP